MAIICIDTQILFWGIIKKPPSNDPNLVNSATDFLKWVDDNDHMVIVPTIVVSEMLIPVPLADHASVLSQLGRDYRIVPFDIVSARKFAEMRRSHIVKNKIRQLSKPSQLNATKTALKADVMIIATAIANGANRLYTYDNNLIKMADGFIDAVRFTDVPFQRSLNLPDEND